MINFNDRKVLVMRKMMFAVLVAGLGSVLSLTVVPAASAAPAGDTVTAMQCVAGGGFVDDDDPSSPTGMRCYGGQYDGVPVTLG